MERTELALAPEWLRSSGNIAGGSASANHTDISSPVQSCQSRHFKSNSEKYRTDFLDGNYTFNSKNSNSNGSGKHPYSSFTRNRSDKFRDKEKEKSLSVDIWHHDALDPLSDVSISRTEDNALKPSHSLFSKRTVEVMPHRAELSKNSISHRGCAIGVHFGVSNPLGIKKNAFEKEFPSLGTEEKETLFEARRNLFPDLNSAVQNLPVGNSGFRGGEKWTSALAEVPAILTNNGTDHTHFKQSLGLLSTSASGDSNTSGLNMAEALSHSPVQFPDKSQRLEELAIKQSRQLIPLTPSPKSIALSSADKFKQSKAGVRTNEMIGTSKAVQLQPHLFHLSNQSRVGQVRSDSLSASYVGRYMILKSGRESTVTSGMKDVSSYSGDSNCNVPNELLATTASVLTSSFSLNSSTVSVLERKAVTSSINSGSTHKRMFQSLAKSRSEFFSLMRRKTSSTVMTSMPISSLTVSPFSSEMPIEILKEEHSSMSPLVFENDCLIICSSDVPDSPEKVINLSDVGENKTSGNGTVYPDEEEAAFLRSLGWEENGGEDECLTEEEINAFYLEYMIGRPSLKGCSNSQLHFSTPECHAATACTTGSDSNTCKSEHEA